MPQVVPLVFFSSTRDDLEEHRVAVQRAVAGLDVLFRGMEFFGSRPEKPREVMLEEVAQCDLYVGIVGQRYGSLDPRTGRSYTELEYREAGKHDIPRMIFVMEDAHAVPGHHVEPSAGGREKLAAFKKELRTVHTAVDFTTTQDLSSKVADSLKEWLSDHKEEWRRMLHRPLTYREHSYIRKLHSQNAEEAEEAVSQLNASSNPIVHEHLYARLYRGDVDYRLLKSVLEQSIHWRDDRRVTQMLLGMVEDLPNCRKLSIRALGGRALIDEKNVSGDEVRCALKYENDPNPDVRSEVAHALGRFYNKSESTAAESVAALERLSNDEYEHVSVRAREVLDKIPHGVAHRARAR